LIADLERRTLDLWPPAELALVDGWVLATSGGHTRRTNSVQPWAAGRDDLPRKIEGACEHFARRGLAPVFKLTDAARPRGLDEALRDLGFRRAGETRVLVRDLDASVAAPDPDGPPVEIGCSLEEDWFADCVRLNGVALGERDALRDILERLPEGSTFARIRLDGETVALALGSQADGHLYLGEVVTRPDARRRGLSRRLLQGVLGEARARGARRAFLGVVSENAPAVGLYTGLGFTERYRYWYRQR
jgi:ribosomal protein S18 acetylase RimI-like enzyme